MISFFTNRKLVQLTVVFLLVLLYSFFLFHKIKLPAADDLPRQITIGQEVLKGNWDILYKNTFAYTEPDYTFYNHHWLSGVIFYILFSIFGWSGLVVIKALILLSVFLLIFYQSVRKSNFWITAIVSLPVIFIIRERTGLRPEVFSYLFIALYSCILINYADNLKSKIIYCLVPLQLLWVNMHVFFSIGFMLTLGFLFERVVHNWGNIRNNKVVRRLTLVLVLIALVSFANPRFVRGVFYRYPNVSVEISENQTIFESERVGELNNDISIQVFKPISAVSVVSIISYLFYVFVRGRKKKEKFIDSLRDVPIFYILAILSTLVLSFVVIRALAMFGFMLLLGLPYLLSPWSYGIRDYAQERLGFRYFYFGFFGLVLVACLIFYWVFFSGSKYFNGYLERGIGLSSMSEGGVNFFKQNKLKGPIFNDTDIGSYLIHYLYPEERVFSDNRFGDAYSPNFWDEVYLPILADDREWYKALNQYKFNTIFLYQYDNQNHFRDFLFRRLNDKEWVFVYGDAFSLIFVRNIPQNKEVIEKYGVNSENIHERLQYLLRSKVEDDLIAAADIFNLFGRLDLSRRTFLDVVINRPQNGKIWMIMAEWELSTNSEYSAILAKMFLENALDVGYKTSEVYSFLGVSYYRLGRIDKAKEVLEKSLEINPRREDAKKLMDIIRINESQGIN